MTLQVKQPEGGDFELVPEGVYVARCYKVIDLGTQQIEYMGEIKFLPKIMITWEILDDPKMKDGRPFAISKTYTASLSEKSHLYKDLVAWRGKAFTKEELLGFDISKLLGAYCQLQVIHKDSKDGSKTFALVNTIMATKERPKVVNDDVLFDIANPNMEVFEGFSDYLKDKIRGSDEWKARDIQAKNAEPKEDEPESDEEPADLNNAADIDGEEIDLKDIPF